MTLARAFLIVAVSLPLASARLLSAQTSDEYPHGDLTMDCGECHVPEKWVPVHEPPTFRHESTGFALLASHRQAACADCHRTLVFDHVGIACGDCHKDAHRGELGFRCESCHTPTTWSNQREMFQVHNRTRFPLMSIHARLDCTACHRDQRPYQYANTPAECGRCHYETYVQTANPNHVQAGFSIRCEDCHGVTSSTWQGARTSHPASFPLMGGHGLLACALCHQGGRYQGLSTECVSCHQADFARTANPSHVAGGFPSSCEDCHTINGWRPANFDHEQSAFPLTGAHGQVDCGSCHVGGRYQGTPSDCAACHRQDYDGVLNPKHSASGFGMRCQDCHNTGAWRPANFDHNSTRFPLIGAHNRIDCASCHPGGRYTGTPTNCNGCHQADYAATTNPNHQAAGYPTQCQNCHNTGAWTPANFNHSSTRFPLTGAHNRVDCAQCHTGGRYAGTPTDCNACHQADYAATTNPNHQTAGYPTQCQNCHTTSAWRPANFDHNSTRFPLTGAHDRVDCAQCHTGGRYAGTPTDCNACHQTDYAATTNPNHQSAGFPTLCQTCHTTSAWRPASFDHDGRYFPIYSGKHRGRWSSCADCHLNPGNYKAFECIFCHEHSNKAEVDDKHKEESGYTYQSSACLRCHPSGRKESLGGPHRLP